MKKFAECFGGCSDISRKRLYWILTDLRNLYVSANCILYLILQFGNHVRSGLNFIDMGQVAPRRKY
jgi:hypothetical protein